jgi:hypothetical protein
MVRNLDFYLKWTATAVIVLATLANAFDIVPLNKILFLLGCILWTWVGLLWRQPSLWTLNLFCGVVYVVGLMLH